MVQIIESNRKPSFSEQVNRGIDAAMPGIQQFMQQRQQADALKQFGIDPAAANLPKEALPEFYKSKFSGENKAKEFQDKINENRKQLTYLGQSRGLEGNELKDFVNTYEQNVNLGEKVTKPTKTTPSSEQVPPNISKTMKKILADNPKATADELLIEMDEAGVPRIYSNQFTENRRRTEEATTKTENERLRELRHETLPLRTEISEKARASEDAIRNKEKLLEIIDRGDINDPTFAAIAQALPLDLGKRLLSPDTVEYKSGLIDEYKDLRTIFKGQTRMKEIDLLEEKTADLYLTDDQKKAILKSRIKASKADIIYAEVAEELEGEPLGILQFQRELERRAKPKLEALFNQILDEHNAIIKDAENRKKVPLDFNDPDDKKIAEALIKEAGGNRNKARELAKKKGYTF